MRGASVRLRGSVVAAAVVFAAATGLVVWRLDSGGGPAQKPGPPLGETALKYRLATRFAPVFFCDPDYYPIGSEEGERANARAWWTAAERGGDEVTTILARLGLSGALSDEQVLHAYREHKRLAAIGLEAAAGTGFRFTLRSGQETNAVQVTGTIARDGTTRVQRRTPANTSCPICLASRTSIDTPDGPVAVSALRPGMRVWTVDEHGLRIVGTVLRTARRAAGSPALLLRVTLADGRSVVASAAHPTAEGRALGGIRPGEALDGSLVASIEVVSVADGMTFDVLPSGPTGRYWADGVLLGSSLERSERTPALLGSRSV
jgi:Hint domain-containing protein